MKVTAFVGSARKKHIYNSSEQLMYNLQAFGDIECETVSLSDFHIEICKGCCFNPLEPVTGKEQKKIDRIIEKHSKKFYSTLIKK
jgi:hypothetical protein